MSTYDIDNKKLASVTTVISDCTDKSPALTAWAANMVVEWIKLNCFVRGTGFVLTDELMDNARTHFREVSQEALDVGSAVHDAIHHWFKTGKEPINPPDQVLAGFLAFLEWRSENEAIPVQTEFIVTDGLTAGTLDFVGYVKGEFTVIDFKSSKAIYPEYRYQTAAYRYMWNHMNPGKVATRNAVLRLDKETGYPEYRDYSKKYHDDLAVYDAMVNLYYLRHPRLAKGAGIPF